METPSDQGPAVGPAAAADRALAVGRVVVGQLFTTTDVARGANPDRVPDDLRVAVGGAGMIDVARDVTADSRVAHVESVQLEAPDVAFFQVPRLTLEAFAIADLLACVVNDPGVLRNRSGCENAP